MNICFHFSCLARLFLWAASSLSLTATTIPPTRGWHRSWLVWSFSSLAQLLDLTAVTPLTQPGIWDQGFSLQWLDGVLECLRKSFLKMNSYRQNFVFLNMISESIAVAFVTVLKVLKVFFPWKYRAVAFGRFSLQHSKFLILISDLVRVRDWLRVRLSNFKSVTFPEPSLLLIAGQQRRKALGTRLVLDVLM